MFKTHLLISLLLGLFTFQFFEINKFIFIALVILAGSLPDIDIPSSKIGKKTRPVSNIINFLFGHRGILHSIFIPVLLFFVLSYYNLYEYGYAVLIGYLGHLLADAISSEGVNFLHPFLKLRIQGFIRVGGFLEYILFMLLIGLGILSIPRLF
ncbi:metal-dependent hydrolase [Candidatus Woesearchaeota archaeon]|nr:metal-dependent hydrolase [Candidatus Woesearchaeota archaeon]